MSITLRLVFNGRLKKRMTPKLSNLLFYSGDAIDFLKREMPPNVFDLLVINFPDPWPKRRHHKRRIITPQSAQTLAYSLKPKGELHTSTDVSSLDASQRSILVSSGHLQWRDSRTYSGQSLETSAFKVPLNAYRVSKAVSIYARKNRSGSNAIYYSKYCRL